MRDLQGRIAFITGASRGIGRATATALARRGAKIAIGYRSQRAAAEEVASEIQHLGSQGVPIQLDVGVAEQRDAAFDAIAKDLGGLDIFVANAAATAFKPLLDIRQHHFEKTFAVTVQGFLFGVQRAVALMEGRGGGQIVAVSGYDCVRTVPRHGLLGAAKASMEWLTRQYAFELGPRGIRANCVSFAYADTDSTRFFAGPSAESLESAMRELTPLRRVATADDVAAAIGFLCSESARSINGQTIMVDGGVLLTAPAPSHLPPAD